MINADDVWGMLGGQDRAGEGINIAIIDSGIDSSHPILLITAIAVRKVYLLTIIVR